MFYIVLIAVIVVIMVVAGKKNYETGKRLKEEGKVAQRQGAFWECAEVFTADTTYEAIREKVKALDLTDAKATAYCDYEGKKSILFKSNDGWNAALDTGEKDGKRVFRFSFIAWQTHNGIVNCIMTMNVMETAIEKTILSLDPAATVETHKMQLKTKSR